MPLSLTGVPCLSKSNIGAEVRGLHGPTGKDAGATVNGVADFNRDLRVLREPNVHARTETDKADALAPDDGFARCFPGNNASGDEAGDLFEFDLAARSGEGEDILFVLRGGFGVPGRKKFARAIVHFGDGAGERSAVDVNVPDCEENTDTRT